MFVDQAGYLLDFVADPLADRMIFYGMWLTGELGYLDFFDNPESRSFQKQTRVCQKWIVDKYG